MLLQMALLHFLTDEQCSIVYAHHVLFTPSSGDGHPGCSHVLATVNSAAVNSTVHVSFRLEFFTCINAQEWDSWIIRQVCAYRNFLTAWVLREDANIKRDTQQFACLLM